MDTTRVQYVPALAPGIETSSATWGIIAVLAGATIAFLAVASTLPGTAPRGAVVSTFALGAAVASTGAFAIETGPDSRVEALEQIITQADIETVPDRNLPLGWYENESVIPLRKDGQITECTLTPAEATTQKVVLTLECEER